jgi:hypothetical protein
MGFDTDMEGSFFTITPKITDQKILDLLSGLSTRRMKRDPQKIATKMNISLNESIEKYGEEGEFYFDDADYGDSTIIDYNEPPKTQCGLWMNWIYDKDSNVLKWNGVEKSYNNEEWLKYLIKYVFEPNGYKLNGSYKMRSPYEEGTIIVKDNVFSIENHIDYYEEAYGTKNHIC